MADLVVTKGAGSVRDVVAPEMAWVSPADASEHDGHVITQITATDAGAGMLHVVPIINGVEQTPIAAPLLGTDTWEYLYPESDVLVETEVTVQFRGVDREHNTTALAARTFTLNVPPPPPPPPADTTDPVATITSPSDGETFTIGTTPILAWTVNVTDNAGGSQLSLGQFYRNGVAYGAAVPMAGESMQVSTSIDPAIWGAGTFTLTFRAYDGNQNEGISSPVEITINAAAVDAPPTIDWDVSSPANGATVNDFLTVAFTGADDVALSQVGFYVNGSLVSTSATAAPQVFRYPLSGVVDAQTQVTAYGLAIDSGGKMTQTAARFFIIEPDTTPPVDGTPPVVTDTNPPDNTTITLGDSVTCSANATDASGVESLQFKVDGVAPVGIGPIATSGTNVNVSFSYTPTTTGTKELTWTATDASSTNNQATSAGRTLIVNAPAPPPPSPPSESLYTPPSGTAIANVYPDPSDVTFSDYTSFGIGFVEGDLETSEVDQLYYCASNGGTARYVQVDNYNTWGDGSVRSATLTLKTPAVGADWIPGQRLTLFKSATETPPSSPTITMTDATFDVELRPYTLQVDVIGITKSPAFRVNDVIEVTFDFGGGITETYNETITSTSDINIMLRLASKIDRDSSRLRCGKWSTCGEYTGFSNEFGSANLLHPANTKAYNSYGDAPCFRWGKIDLSQPEAAYYWAPIFHRQLANGTDPLPFTTTITITAGSPSTVATQTVRAPVNRAAAIAHDFDSFGTEAMTWKDGRLVKEVWRVGTVGYKGLIMWMGLRKDRDGNIVKREVHLCNTAASNVAAEECHYDFQINGGGGELRLVNDLIHSRMTMWSWPTIDRKLTLVDLPYMENASRVPKIWQNGEAYNLARITNRLRNASISATTNHPYPMSEVGEPLHRGSWDYGQGIAGGPDTTSWAWDVIAQAIKWWRADALRYAMVFERNGHGAIPMHFDDDTAVGVLANGPVDPYHLTKRRWQSQNEGVSSAYRKWDQHPWNAITASFFSLKASRTRKLSHGVGGGLLGSLITGEFWFHRMLEHAAQENIFTSYAIVGGQGKREVGTNTDYSANGVYLRSHYENNALRGINTKFGDILRLDICTGNNHPRRAFWDNIIANFVDEMEKNIQSNNLSTIPFTYGNPTKDGAVKAQPIVPAGPGTGANAMWHWGYCASSFGYYAKAGNKFDTFMTLVKDAVGWWEQAPLIEGKPYLLGSLASMPLCELDNNTIARTTYDTYAECWTEFDTSLALQAMINVVNRSSSGTTRTLTLAQRHDFRVGDPIGVEGGALTPPAGAAYSVAWNSTTITSVSADRKTITYEHPTSLNEAATATNGILRILEKRMATRFFWPEVAAEANQPHTYGAIGCAGLRQMMHYYQKTDLATAARYQTVTDSILSAYGPTIRSAWGRRFQIR